MTSSERASLLTIPCELRNAIYSYLLDTDHVYNVPPERPNEHAVVLKIHRPDGRFLVCSKASRATCELAFLQTCRQIHDEAYPMALAMTTFHIRDDCTYPDLFDLRSRPLSPAKLSAIRHLTLTARISHLRALNEAWANLPFGHPSLRLDKLTVFPTRAEVHTPEFPELADLSQSHTLAYIFCETLKGLRNVACVEVRNGGCFNESGWSLLYRSMVYRLWQWGGGRCGIRFENGETLPGGIALIRNQWFRAYFGLDEQRGSECGEEVCRMIKPKR